MEELPNAFRDKWSSFSAQRDPTTGKSLAEVLGAADKLNENRNGGDSFQFANGALVSDGSNISPFLVFGEIYRLWVSVGGTQSGYGHPITDPQFLADGSVCSIFVGGHLHKFPGKKEAEPFPADNCSARYQPPVPQYLLHNASSKWPLNFRNKWTWLSTQRDPGGNYLAILIGPTDSWPHDWAGLTDNDNGGETLHFRAARLVSYDNVTAPFPVYGKIFSLWDNLGGVKSGLGHPIADPQFLADGSTCIIFEGGHVHQIGKKDAEIFPADQCTTQYQPTVPVAVSNASSFWPPIFRSKWIWLSSQRDRSNQQLGVLMGPADSWPHGWAGLTDNDNGGRTLHFRGARLVSYDNVTAPFPIYGKIFTLWDSIGGLKSGLGHPIADPQSLPDGSTCIIFEGGHVHQIGKRDAEIFPASQCTAGHQPTVPTAVLNASSHWPQLFRNKWIWLSTQRDPSNQQLGALMGPTDSWPHSWAGLTDNENDNGGQSLHFRGARLVSYDRVTAPFPIYGKIFGLWDSLGGLRSGLGHPIADPQFLENGSTCIIFEGGHVHQIGKKDAEIFPESQCTAQQPTMPAALSNASPYWTSLFRAKWTWLSSQRDPSNQQLGVLLGPTDSWPHNWAGLTENDTGGHTLHFRSARLVSYDNVTTPFPIYGKIFTLWNSLGGLKSVLGYPISDPQFLPDGSTCIIFEGGHVHQIGTKDAGIFPANECSVPNQPTGRPSRPSATYQVPSYQAASPSATYQPSPSNDYQAPPSAVHQSHPTDYHTSPPTAYQSPPTGYQAPSFGAYQLSPPTNYEAPPLGAYQAPSAAYQPPAPVMFPYNTPSPPLQGYPQQPQYGYPQPIPPQGHSIQQGPYMSTPAPQQQQYQTAETHEGGCTSQGGIWALVVGIVLGTCCVCFT